MKKIPGRFFSLSELFALQLSTILNKLSLVAQATQHKEPKKCKHKFLKSASQNSILFTFAVSFFYFFMKTIHFEKLQLKIVYFSYKQAKKRQFSMKDFTMKEIPGRSLFLTIRCVIECSIPKPSYSHVASAIGHKKDKICSFKEISISAAI